jgi:hypothetical protein
MFLPPGILWNRLWLKANPPPPTAFFNTCFHEHTGSYNIDQNELRQPAPPVVAGPIASRDEDMRQNKNRQRFPRKTDRRVDQNEREALEKRLQRSAQADAGALRC